MNTYKMRSNHGIMFHDFYDKKIHFLNNGSIDKNLLNGIVNLMGKKNIFKS